MRFLTFAAGALAGLLAVLPAGPGRAAIAIDTGTPTGTSGWMLGDGSPGSTFHRLAAKIDVTAWTKVTRIEADLQAWTRGTLAFELRADAGVPGDLIFSRGLVADYWSKTPEWRGFTDLDWVLAPGSYWIALVAQDGLRAGTRDAVPAPLARYAFASDPVERAWSLGDRVFALRVSGDTVAAPPSPVPLPASGLLLLAGLAGTGIALRRKANPALAEH